MNICIVGKYPPIQGGVSKETYWIARGLAKRGHKVFMVTNALEVEKRYRIFLEEEDDVWLEPRFPDSGGEVTLCVTESFSHRRMSHIPLSNPFVTQLAGTACAVIRNANCSVALGYYLEPYGLATHLAAYWTGVPYALRHAGSDTDRLMTVSGLGEAYRQAFRRADAILTTPGLVGRFLTMGVPHNRLVYDLAFDLPEVFTPSHSALDIDGQLARARNWMEDLPASVRGKSAPFDPKRPTIGLYGKVGETKGSYDLIAALSLLKRQGYEFNFLCMVNGVGLPRFVEGIIGNDLVDNTWMLPFLPHWKVPGFIRACTAVCFLERDFPIAIHGPSVPREVMACGTCLIVSGEIANKQSRFFDFRSGENCIVVADPKQHEDLAAAVASVLSDPAWSERLGRAGTELMAAKSAVDWLDLYEDVFSKLGEFRGAVSPAESATGETVPDRSWEALFPWTARLSAIWPDRVVEHTSRNGVSVLPVENALLFSEKLLESLSVTDCVARLIREVVLLERAALLVTNGMGGAYVPGEPQDSLSDQQLSVASILRSKPSRNPHAITYEFGYDLPALQSLLEDGDSGNAAVPSESPSLVLIVALPNCSVKRMRISPLLRQLFDLCNGQQSVLEMAKHLSTGNGIDPGADWQAQICQALLRLYEAGAVRFSSGVVTRLRGDAEGDFVPANPRVQPGPKLHTAA